jgi:hypothetical protein
MILSWRGLALGLFQLALVLGVGGKMLFDRATCPRGWTKTVPVDPELPIRGRYVRLRLAVPLVGASPETFYAVRLDVSGEGRLIATPAEGPGAHSTLPFTRANTGDSSQASDAEAFDRVLLNGELAYFISEHAQDPTRVAPGDELWVEVTLPRAGPPRPIRLGILHEGRILPLPH